MINDMHITNKDIATMTWADKRRQVAWELFHKRQCELNNAEAATIDNILGRG